MNQPQITPGSNGYLAPLEQVNYTNPWAAPAAQDSAQIPGMLAKGRANLSGLQSQMSGMQNMDQYPSFPNSGGLGSQQAYANQPPVQSQQQYQASPTPMTTGANPWSFQGEAMAR